jgi:hypothetical protein
MGEDELKTKEAEFEGAGKVHLTAVKVRCGLARGDGRESFCRHLCNLTDRIDKY